MQSILRDPSGWAEILVGSKARLSFWLAFHVLMAVLIIRVFGAPKDWLLSPLVVFAAVVWLPGHYLYALYRLVRDMNDPKPSVRQ